MGEHGSLLDCRQRPVRLLKNQDIGLLYSFLRHITPDPMSNPVIYYLKWVVSETVGGFNAGETESRGNRITIKQVSNRKSAEDPTKTMVAGLLVQNILSSMNKHGRSDERRLH